LDRDERPIWIADAHRDDGKRSVVRDYLRIHDSISGLDAAAWKRMASSMDGSNPVKPALLQHRCEKISVTPLVLGIVHHEVEARIISGVLISHLHLACLEPVIRRQKTKDESSDATKR
jgi:hypothetical protein